MVESRPDSPANKICVMVAGLGGASLGTELIKALALAGRYWIFGCDISAHAFGHFQAGTEQTFVIERQGYVERVVRLCTELGVEAVIPGGEEPLRLINAARSEFARAGIHVAANSQDVVSLCMDKAALFEHLRDIGCPIPWTLAVTSREDLDTQTEVPLPCVIKPATGTGGSALTFLCATLSEALHHVDYVLESRPVAIVQEYLPHDSGEYTIGVLNMPDGSLAGSVALRRLFDAKLSVLQKNEVGLISSGWSQGLIDDYAAEQRQAEAIAAALSSCGPMNVQARLRANVLYPFEINPRFSASTYLRAMAGFNEVDIYLQWVLRDARPAALPLARGYYLRSLTETYVPLETQA